MALLPHGTLPVTPSEPGPPGTRLHAPEHPASPGELVAGTVRDSMAKARTHGGLSNSYFSGVGRALLRRFEKAQADAEREAKLGAKVLQKARDVSGVLSRSGTMEDPLARSRGLDPLASLPSQSAAVEDAHERVAYALPHAWTRSEGVVVVRLTQAADGRVLSAELLASSGDAGLDGAAVSSVKALGEDSAPPPPEVLGGRNAVVSEWRFELLRTVAGPGGYRGGLVGTFDVTSGLEGVLPSFAGTSKVRVTLVAYR